MGEVLLSVDVHNFRRHKHYSTSSKSHALTMTDVTICWTKFLVAEGDRHHPST
ncbi:MAG TPA: hypothetical protein V6C84_04230 [Coleofasciculaceae cyanobacterium]